MNTFPARNSLKTFLTALSILLFAASSQCFALRSFAHVSKERAKELGIEIQANAKGPDAIWVQLDFKTEGELNYFSAERGSLVELEIKEGEKTLLTAALQVKQPILGHNVVSFVFDRAQVNEMTLTVVVGHGAMAGGAYILRVNDFIESEKFR